MLRVQFIHIHSELDELRGATAPTLINPKANAEHR